MSPKKMHNYLKSQGYPGGYRQYLLGKTWGSIRSRVMKRDRWTCQCCGNKGDNAHHIKYTPRNLSGRSELKFIITLCRTCHEDIHAGNPLSKANRILSAKMIRNGRGNLKTWISRKGVK